jgi:restriction system protein
MAAIGVVTLVVTGLVASVEADARGLPSGTLAGVALLVLALAIPTGRWELRNAMRVYRARERERQIARLAPLASLLGVSPLVLDRVTVETLYGLSPSTFERAMGELLALRGYREVVRTGGPGDLAADLACRDRKGQRVVAQCKRFAPSHHVGSGEIQKFLGMIVVHHQARMGLFLTTSSYTSNATKLAQHHADRVRLVDGPQLVAMVRELAVR